MTPFDTSQSREHRQIFVNVIFAMTSNDASKGMGQVLDVQVACIPHNFRAK